MKVILTPASGAAPVEVLWEQTIRAKHVHDKRPVAFRRQLRVSKHGRLVTVRVPAEIEGRGKCFLNLTFKESEVLLMAQLCRRGRTDDQFLRAIDVALPTPAPPADAEQ